MGNFNFGKTIENNSGIASDKVLKPYSINKVKFVEAKVDIQHSDKNGTDYNVINLRFENKEGYYNEKYFLPEITGKDVERQPNSWGKENPSNAERAMMFFAHTLSVINNEGYHKLQKVVNKAKDFKDVAMMVEKLLNEKKGLECYLKLVGRDNNGVIYASLPYFASVGNNGDPYVNNNFLSLKDDLSFTASEDKKRQEYEKVKPTSMSKSSELSSLVSDEPSSNNSDLDNVEVNEDEISDLEETLKDL